MTSTSEFYYGVDTEMYRNFWRSGEEVDLEVCKVAMKIKCIKVSYFAENYDNIFKLSKNKTNCQK